MINGGSMDIEKMYTLNLEHYTRDDGKFDEFCQAMIKVAKHFNIHAFFYDEVHRLGKECQGQFIRIGKGIDGPFRVCSSYTYLQFINHAISACAIEAGA